MRVRVPAARLTAVQVKDAIRGRHPATIEGAPGAWTCVEEYRNIDLLAVSAWASVKPYPRYARVGYEVKVSRGDYRRELARPFKRAAAVAFCHEFYFAVPSGLLKSEEIEWTPPWGFAAEEEPLEPTRCPGAFGSRCSDGRIRAGVVDRRRSDDPRPLYGRVWSGDPGASRYLVEYGRAYSGPCPTCRGSGEIAPPPAVRADAPPLWVPDDVGLLVVYQGGRTMIAKKAPRRKPGERLVSTIPLEVGMTDHQLAELIRWVSVRPDPRHAELRRNGRSGAPSAPLAASDGEGRASGPPADGGALRAPQ